MRFARPPVPRLWAWVKGEAAQRGFSCGASGAPLKRKEGALKNTDPHVPEQDDHADKLIWYR